MTLNFSDLAARLRAGETASPANLHDILTASPAATFALMELAAELRATHFGSTITAINLLGAPERQVASSLVEVAAPLDADALAATLADLAADPAVEHIDVDFVGVPALAPMEALRVLAAARLAWVMAKKVWPDLATMDGDELMEYQAVSHFEQQRSLRDWFVKQGRDVSDFHMGAWPIDAPRG